MMITKDEPSVKDNSEWKYGDQVPTIEEPSSSDTAIDKLSLIFTQLFYCSEGLNPSFFTNKELASLCVTSRPLRSAVVSELQRRDAQRLSAHVVKGEQEEAQAIIEKNPKLLLIRTSTIDNSGRTITGTPFQVALGAGDTPMWEMMLPYLENQKKGEALRQFDEQFPDGIEDMPASELQKNYNAIVSAINQEADNGLSVIEKFKNELTSPKKITKGKHFNVQHLIAVYQACSDNFKEFGNCNSRMLFWKKVVGYVQRQMTAYDAQMHCSNLERALENKRFFKRTFAVTNGAEFFPLGSGLGLGFDFAYSTVGGQLLKSDVQIRRGVNSSQTLHELLERFCKEKNAALSGLRELLQRGMDYQFNQIEKCRG